MLPSLVDCAIILLITLEFIASLLMVQPNQLLWSEYKQNHVREEVTWECERGNMEHTHANMHISSHQQWVMRPYLCVCQELQSEGAFRDVEVVIAGLSNIYTHYITTFEEYQVCTFALLYSTYQSFIVMPSTSCDLLLFRCNDMKALQPSLGRTHSAHTCRSTEDWPEPLHRQVWHCWPIWF